jgi:selenide,water dikinase
VINNAVRLTHYSHGAGCGCKIAPDVLGEILAGSQIDPDQYPDLLVGNHSRDDAAAVDLGDGRAILTTTDFFMPIVDDPFDFGRVAATNAISDIYAMGGRPLAAIAILGWPIDKLAPGIAARVVAGGRSVCSNLGFPLAGGHSIDCPEPIFGLAVTGEVTIKHLKRNSTGCAGDQLYLTKPLGIGVLTTAEKQGKLQDKHQGIATQLMCQPNQIGQQLSAIPGVNAMTDVTGFGLLGHLLEFCEGGHLSARIDRPAVPLMEGLVDYIAQGCTPGGTARNFHACRNSASAFSAHDQSIFCDPQTSGGLLIAVAPYATAEVEKQLAAAGLPHQSIGELEPMVGNESQIRLTG